VYEKRDFEVYLDYAKEKKLEDCNNGKITANLLKIELDKINNLKRRVNGKVREDYQQSSVSYRRNHGTATEREHDGLPKAPFIRVD
jgi:hypothetical protein